MSATRPAPLLTCDSCHHGVVLEDSQRIDEPARFPCPRCATLFKLSDTICVDMSALVRSPAYVLRQRSDGRTAVRVCDVSELFTMDRTRVTQFWTPALQAWADLAVLTEYAPRISSGRTAITRMEDVAAVIPSNAIRADHPHPREVDARPFLLAAGDLVLHVVAPPNVQKLLYFRQFTRIAIGRVIGDIILASDDRVSGSHGAIVWEDGELVYRDSGSTNGSWSDGRRIERERLAPNSEIHLGRSGIRVLGMGSRASDPGTVESKSPETRNMSGRGLTQVPDEVLRETRLVALNLSANRICDIPEAIDNLAELRVLDLSYNDLSALPHSLRRLTKLERLLLAGNPRLGLPLSVTGESGSRSVPTPASILDYYFTARAERRPFGRAKIVVLGHERAGKTTTIGALLPDAEAQAVSPDAPLTVFRGQIAEVAVSVWELPTRTPHVFARDLYLDGAGLFIIVISGPPAHAARDLELWMRVIGDAPSDVQVIVVYTGPELPPTPAQRNLAANTARHYDYVALDVVSHFGHDRLRSLITEAVRNLRTPAEMVPRYWDAIMDAVRSHAEPTIGVDRFRELCRKHGETDPPEQQRLGALLHRSGDALYFSDDPDLGTDIILDPHWLVRLVMTIAAMPPRSDGSALIPYEDVRGALHGGGVPAELDAFALALLTRTGLCRPLASDLARDSYVVSALLASAEPPVVEQYSPDKCLNFEFHYEDGAPLVQLVPAIMAAIHGHILHAWVGGLTLEWEGCHALLLLEPGRQRLTVRIRGMKRRRRPFLSIIRADLARVHSSFSSLRVSEHVPLPNELGVTIPYADLRALDEANVESTSLVLAGRVVQINIPQILDGVDSAGPAIGLRAFISFSPEDDGHRVRLEKVLSLLRHQGKLSVWHERRVLAGQESAREIERHLGGADLILLLVSADFIGSDHCYDEVMTRALARHRSGEALVIAIIVRECDWHDAPFSHCRVLPPNGRAITSWPDVDAAWKTVAEGIRAVVDERLAHRQARHRSA